MTEEIIVQDSLIENANDEQLEQEVNLDVNTNDPVDEDKHDVFYIDGIGEVTKDDIVEWRKGNMRQSDYTKKTQALAQEKQEAKEAMEFWNYLKANPELAKKMKELDANGVPLENSKVNTTVNKLTPEMQEIQQLKHKMAEKELDDEIKGLQNKYNDFDLIKVLTFARDNKIDDLEIAYKATRDIPTNVDVKKLEADAVAKAKAELAKEIENNTKTTVTILGNDKGGNPVTKQVSLSDKEAFVASQMGLSPEEYAKWKT